MSVRDGEHLTRPPVIILPLMPLLVYIAPSLSSQHFFLIIITAGALSRKGQTRHF